MTDQKQKTALTAQAGPQGSPPAPTAGGGGFLVPQTLDEAMRVSSVLADSTFVPKDYQGRPGNVLVAMQMGAELGLPPMQALQNVAVINGRPAIWGDALLGIVKSSGLLEYIREEDDGQTATCTVKRKGDAEPVVQSFSMEEAKRAGLAGKSGPWQQYPKRMRQMRARSFALRDAFADVLKGLHLAEEAQDMPEEPRDITPPPERESAPKSKTAAVKQALASRRGGADEEQTHPADDSDGPTEAEVAKELREAADEAALSSAAGKAATFSGEARTRLRAAYKERLEQLRAPAAHAPGDDYDPGIPDPIEKLKDELRGAAGDEVAAILDGYASIIEHLEENDPETYQAIMDLAEERHGAMQEMRGAE